MNEVLTALHTDLPWIVNLFQFVLLIFVILRLTRVLDNALSRAQGPALTVPAQVPSAPVVHLPGPPAPTPIAKPPVSVEDQVVDQGLVNFVKKAEGFQSKAYWDYKQYSIGYGTRANSPTEVITEAEGEARLRAEIDKAYKLVESKFPNLPKGVMQALTDLTYNAGPGWETGSLGNAVGIQKWDTVKADILQYNHAGGQVNAGLTARREAEVSWFDNPL